LFSLRSPGREERGERREEGGGKTEEKVRWGDEMRGEERRGEKVKEKGT
jgi:hypothetical protein